MTLTIQKLADRCDAQIVGGDASEVLTGASDIITAQVNQVTTLTDKRYAKYLDDSLASACFVSENFDRDSAPGGMALLVSADPEISFIKAVNILHPAREYKKQIAEQAVLEDNVTVGQDVSIGSYATIGADSVVGEGTDILPGVYIGQNVKLGMNCRIYPYAVIYDDVQIGDNVIIHSGAIIGSEGFGYKTRNQQHIKVPQVGQVVIEDNVEIGANTCIDRGTFGNTYLGAGSKIDNLVQIGHNNKVGKNVIMCGHTGVSGSCEIGDNVILAGSAGIADHVKIGRHSVVMARSGVATDVDEGVQVFGSPAKERKTAWRELSAIAKLPDLMKKVKKLEDKIEELEKGS